MDYLRGRKGITGAYEMGQSGGNDKAHGAVYQGSITLYFRDCRRTGEGLTFSQSAYAQAARFLGKERHVGNSFYSHILPA